MKFPASEMTCIVSSGALKLYSLTPDEIPICVSSYSHILSVVYLDFFWVRVGCADLSWWVANELHFSAIRSHSHQMRICSHANCSDWNLQIICNYFASLHILILSSVLEWIHCILNPITSAKNFVQDFGPLNAIDPCALHNPSLSLHSGK